MQRSSCGIGAAHRVRVARRVALLLLPLALLLAPRDAHAYVWMLSHQYTACGACHTDPSGGELLTAYGRLISGDMLSMKWGGSSDSAALPSERKLAFAPALLAARAKLATKDEETASEEVALEESEESEASESSSEEAPAEESSEAVEEESSHDITPFLFGLVNTPDWLLLGGSYRHLNIITPQSEKKFRTFPMMMDVYGQVQFGSFRAGGSLGAARVPAGSPYARAAQVTGNQDEAWNLISRTHYVGYDITPELMLRAGRLNLPFGIRLPEHIIWARQATRTDRESAQQHGVSVHYAGEQFRFELMGIAGNYQLNPDQYRERGYSGYFEYFLNNHTVLGVSSLTTVAKNDRLVQDGASMTRMAHGGILRSGIGPVTVLLEADALIRSRFEPGYVGFLQVDYEAVTGLHFMVTGEALDEGHSKAADAPARAPGAGKPKLGGWLSASWWFLPHFDVRLDAIKRTQEDVQILAQLHCYL